MAKIGFVVTLYICAYKTHEDMKIAGIPGTSFSPSRALGIDVIKRKIARATGVPTTKQGLERKVGRLIIKSVSNLMSGH
jgi:hypothetical protein